MMSVVSISSCSEIPSIGQLMSADEPPLMTTINRSSAVALSIRRMISLQARSPSAFGSGWPPTYTSVL